MADETTNEKSKKEVTVKVLVPAPVAGNIIGKGGEGIKDIKKKCTATIRVSGREELFPFAEERIVLVVGTADATLQVLDIVQEKYVFVYASTIVITSDTAWLHGC